MKITRVVTNKMHCNLCDTTIESEHQHDFVSCKCGNIAVDGGKAYLRRVGDVHHVNCVELSETYEEDYTPSWEPGKEVT